MKSIVGFSKVGKVDPAPKKCITYSHQAPILYFIHFHLHSIMFLRIFASIKFNLPNSDISHIIKDSGQLNCLLQTSIKKNSGKKEKHFNFSLFSYILKVIVLGGRILKFKKKSRRK